MVRKVSFLDLRVDNKEEREALLSAIDKVLRHGRIILGPEVRELETRLAAYTGRRYAVGVNSGTDALILALKSAGIGPGDEIITTSLSWIATANAIALCGAEPVFADIGYDLNIDPGSVSRLVTPRTKAILPVHYTGKVCRMKEIGEIAEKNGLLVVEDAAQAFGAEYFGRKAGALGDIACFSMNSMKVFASCGEAGIVFTDEKDVYDRLLSLRYNGTVNRETCVQAGLNARIDTIQAAILLKRFGHIDSVIARRREIAGIYAEELGGVVDLPEEKEHEKDVYYTYTIRCEKRDELVSFLKERGIETKVHHPVLMPDQPAYSMNARGEFSNARALVKRILSLPANEKLEDRDVLYVAEAVKEFYGGF